ncbi:FKBP-type peptidyl-prolyl cis-trans isomerase [Winogradskyella bathintestinalis]|uniref:Peptidylprolyl isomerase n=1 Tax=Winogradskyella bathintestinalis TaxID=3035208 RepID=A0ABT7ZWE0_9FLAO|nr:hypothetical protein [Winogradskyella bathintestinalis]MDN3493324.1 hypothetical protein [Winogradskyella bathintestinalis]
MKIKTLLFTLSLMVFTALFISCNKDDDGDDGPTFVEADRTEQQAEDNAEILAYLNSHYYNSSFFATGSNHKYTDIIISELPMGINGEYDALPDPTNNTLLIDAVNWYTTTYLDTEYTYYVLNINQGGGAAPKFTDEVRVRYEGSTINEEVGGEEDVFDSAVTPADFALQTDGTNNAVIKAWQLVMPLFKASINENIDANGNVSFINSGLGVMFVPSGLAYFSSANTGAAYDNLIFKFELLQVLVEDHDNDGVPSYIEDLNGNSDVTDDDTNEDGLPDFIDVNDDGDNVLTIDELIPNTYTVDTNVDEEEPILATNEFERSRTELAGVITIKTVTIADANDNDIPDYLEDSIEINYNLNE